MGKPSDLCSLTAKQAVRLMHDGKLRPEELTEAYLERIAEREPTVRAFACFDPGYARQSAASARPGPLHGMPIGIKDVLDTADMPSRIRLSHLERLAAQGRLRPRRLGPPGRRRGDRQDRHHRVRHPHARPHDQPRQSRPHARRLVLRLRRRRRRRPVPAGLRHPDRRQRDPSGRLLRRRRLQADLRPDQPHRHEAHVRQPRHHRHHRPHRRRLRPVRLRRLRPRPRRPRRSTPAPPPASASAAPPPGPPPRRKPRRCWPA